MLELDRFRRALSTDATGVTDSFAMHIKAMLAFEEIMICRSRPRGPFLLHHLSFSPGPEANPVIIFDDKRSDLSSLSLTTMYSS